jgi:hypothetical protein
MWALDQLPSSLSNELGSLLERLDSGAAPAQAEIEDALERGFACLVALEAELQRKLSGRYPDATEEPSPDKLRATIDSLRGLLTGVRERTQTAPLGLGFVRGRRTD